MFKTIIPLETGKSDQVSDQADEDIRKVLEYCEMPRKMVEILEFMNYKNKTHFRRKILNLLIKGGLLKLTIPDKPTSPNQKYYSENR